MSPVPGSLFRKILFWMHLSCGVVAGLLILLMSATGVLLTYERQMIDAAARSNHVEAPAGQSRRTIDELAAAARATTSVWPVSASLNPLHPVAVNRTTAADARQGDCVMQRPMARLKDVIAVSGRR